ncbi:STAS domain-containing protein [Bacillus sp. H-16]|uniref:STAS domain-containing protein n=1 Tax=Alteribacter salitolerans TaxID=2912333 RepID=UPI0019648834|nr:STAS domain-containing protein [Alteribacter salitolerans]MBM7097428.1 STAS domain-containing protein [Alteribacter salitolerans]
MMSENHMVKIGEAIIERSEELSIRLSREHDGKYSSSQNLSYSAEETIEHRKGFFVLLGEALLTGDIEEKLNQVYMWGKNAGKEAVKHGISADTAVLSLNPIRKALYEAIREEFNKLGLGFDAYFDVSDRLDPIIDHAVYSFTQAFVEYNDETFSQAQDELLELSVPVVPLTGNVAILPVIGTIDTFRSKKMLDQALERGTELGLSYMIIDLSGVHMIDTAVAHNLFQLNDALKIVGIKAIISGLRPELAQTIVSLGISFNHMTVTNSLEQALMKTGLTIQPEDTVETKENFKKGLLI